MVRRVPILRHGRPYFSLDELQLDDTCSGEPVALVSQANPGLIARDLQATAAGQQALAALTCTELVEICKRAAQSFVAHALPVGDSPQTPDDYVREVSATTSLPHKLVRHNMAKLESALSGVAAVLAGLTRGLAPDALDCDISPIANKHQVSYLRLADSLGAILPSNSPGVHGLWFPAIPLKVPLVLRPGRREPWTPMRIAQALIASGCPPEAISIYPSGHSGANEILLRTDRSLLFGDGPTVAPWRHDPRVQLHGPGRSKILFGLDWIDDWERLVDVMIESIATNSGRSCLNTSSVWVPRHGDAVAERLATSLRSMVPRPLDHPEADLAGFESAGAHALSDWIDRQLHTPGAVEIGVVERGPRLVQAYGGTFLLPTVVHCTDPQHPLANIELPFPFVSVVEVAHDKLLASIGSTLVASAFTDDASFRRALLTCRDIDRLNLGAIATTRIAWDQPHEGNLFAHLYRQRALAVAN